ncbi:MAG: (2Fe-2S)-binding protein [Alphaproteobacteria bacterium]|jgi:2-furoyl-CoA dehydrogenase 2Fe-2S iron sulfur subunit|nr:(2Fe-2S)-binding protein [Alphaproteobacteria bacterium]
MRELNGAARHRIGFTLNGRAVSGWAEPRLLLTDFLRQELGETGTHVGCEHGICGACTIRIDGRAVRGCLYLAVQADGREVQTVEGLADPDGALNALQRAFRKHHALQCGYCTPGLLMSLTDLFARTPRPSEAQILDVVGGHLCRCTGYAGIMAAAREVAAEP